MQRRDMANRYGFFTIPCSAKSLEISRREYLYALTHDEALDTVILETGDGMAISVKKE